MQAQLITPSQAQALRVLSDTLRAQNIRFVVIGGLASIAWGAQRPLIDIDIQIDRHDMQRVRKLFLKALQTDIRHYVSEHWDVQQMVVTLFDVGVDICQAQDFFIVVNGERRLVPNSLVVVYKEVCGVSIPVLPKEELIRYKRQLARPVDLADIAALV